MIDKPTHATSVHPLGFRRLDPLPDESSLRAFYGEEYYEGLDSQPRRGPDLARLQAGDDAATPERAWLEATLYADIRHYVQELGREAGRLLDVGCGTGDFLESMRSAGWEVEGIDLSRAAANQCTERGLNVERAQLQSLRTTPENAYDVITLLNVLEHVSDPVGDLQATHHLLRPGGCVVVQVPNDFSVLQQAASDTLQVDPWWIAVPDHLNYFDYESLERTLEHAGFNPLVRSGSFPMELFLLLGSDYITDPDLGSRVHALRRELELNLQPLHRRAMAEAFAVGGMGRNCLVVAKK